ncbi:MAG: hypothetical protein ACREGE_00375 [Candidatus Microsaccharimonas sp.]
MSPRQALAGVTGAVFVSVFLILTTPVSGADYTATAAGSVNITFSVPSTPGPDPQPEPDPDPQPEQPFDWNWRYDAPTCDGVTVAFPSNLPASQQGVMEVNVTGGSVSGMQYKLEGQDYQVKYPNGHAGQTVFIPWADFRNFAIPETGTWSVTQLQVHGTNYHWQGTLVCESEPAANIAAPESKPEPDPVPVVVPEPAPAPEPAPEPEPQPQPESIPAPVPAPAPEPEPQPAPEPEPQPEPAPVPEPQSEEVARPQAVVSVPSPEVPDELPPDESQTQEGVTEE